MGNSAIDMGNSGPPSQWTGPPSQHGGQFTSLVWSTSILVGFKRPGGSPIVCTANELEQIIAFGAPYKSCICARDGCGSPNPFGPDGGAPAAQMRHAFPHLDFQFQPHWVGFRKHAHWEHEIIIRRKDGAVGGAVAASSMVEVVVPDPVPAVLMASLPDGRQLQVSVPAGTQAGAKLQVAY